MQRTNPHQSSTPFWFFPSPAIPSVEVRGSLWPLGHLQATAIEAALRYQIEALKFLQNRLNSDLRLLEDCQSPDHQNDLFDYVNGGARFADMGSVSIRKTTKRLHDDEKRFVENMAAQVVM